jgi:hypothetical protein
LMQPLGMVCLYCDGVFVFELKRVWRGMHGEAVVAHVIKLT